MKTSVIIPVYKDPKGLEITLKSSINQTLPKDQYEIVVCNDGSDKEVTKVCEKYNIVRVVNTRPNKGSYGARNEAIKISKGKYIAFIDADIKASKDWLEKGYNLLRKYDYVGGRVDIDKTKLKTTAHYYEYLTAFNNEKKMNKDHYSPTANLFVKKEVIEDIGMFDERLKSGGDVEFGNRVYDSKKYNIFYSDKLKVVHPPRGYKALVKKNIRITKGRMDLYKYYPERYQKKRISVKTFFTKLILPTLKVLTSRKKVPCVKKIMLIFFGLFLGTVNSLNLRRLIIGNDS
jgi:glycosyltransferase AglI